MNHKVLPKHLESFERTQNIVSLVEFNAFKIPNAIAVECDGRKINYQELYRYSSSIAYRIEQQQLEAPKVVAVHIEKSAELISSFLAILQCGLTFLPLDTCNPVEYNKTLIKNAKADLLLTTSNCELDIVPVIKVEPFASATLPTSIDFSARKPVLAAYCCFTSGTTALPKGVLVGHESIYNLILDWLEKGFFGNAEKFSFWTAQTFDVSIWEWLLPLSLGATVCIVPQDIRVDPRAFLNWLTKKEITSSYFPPFIVRLIPELSQNTDYFPRTILIGVEPFIESKIASALPNSTNVINGYGPTEATVYATTYSKKLQNVQRNIPIGKPVLNTGIVLLDEKLNLVEDENLGQIAIFGPNLAMGYIHDEALTQAKFVKNPYSIHFDRMYLTGDLARRLPSGDLEFIGRIDDQVKIRGYRVELNHVKLVMEQTHFINEAQLLVINDNVGSNYLAAFFTLSENYKSLFDIGKLKEMLAEQLPEYMLPSKWQELNEMPLTTSGKINKKVLARMLEDRCKNEVPSTQSSDLHSVVKNVWVNVLGPAFDENQEFNGLGGTSIQKVSIQFQLSRQLEQLNEIPEIKNHTFTQYADEVLKSQEKLTGKVSQAAEIKEQKLTNRRPLTSVQKQILFNELYSGGAKAYYFHAAFELSSNVNINQLKKSINTLVSRYAVLRATVQLDQDSYFFEETSTRPQIKLHHIGNIYRGYQDFRNNPVLKDCLSEKFNIENAPLIRWHIFTFEDNKVVLVQSEHHLVHDGMSFRILANELAGLYSGSDARLGSDNYLEYCRLDEQYRNSETYLELVQSYSRLISNKLDISTSIFDNYESVGTGSQIRQFISKDISQKLQSTANRLGFSLYILMLGAMGITLKEYFSKTSFFIGTALHNRSSFFDSVGMFVNTLPLYFKLEENTGIKQLLVSLNTELQQANNHSNVVLSDVYKALRLSKRYKGRSIYDVAFSFHDSLDFCNDFGDVSCRLLEGLADNTTKFPLNIVVIKGNPSPSGDLELVFEYDDTLLSENEVLVLIDNFITSLSAIVQLNNFELPTKELRCQSQRPSELSVTLDADEDGRNSVELNPSLVEKVRIITQETLGKSHIADDQDLFEIGLHSLAMMRMAIDFQKAFGVDLKLRKLYKLTTIILLSEYIQAQQTTEESTNER